MKNLIYFLLILSFFTACRSKVEPNEWVVSTTTCWNTIDTSKAGDLVPILLTKCDRMVRLPSTLMSGELQTTVKFNGKISSKISVTYQWSITDPIKFVHNSKSITSGPTDDSYRVDPLFLEEIENTVVDKSLINVIREITAKLDVDIVDLELEELIASKISDSNEKRGITFSNISLVVEQPAQIEEARDVISALKYYEELNEREFGEKVILAKAGAASINNSEKE
ncbi:MAG TPA: hypothetical protein PJ990_09495 [Saprospiraceae bacterium]|nr:hypothetical protein [Saprospiraceae bacterium]